MAIKDNYITFRVTSEKRDEFHKKFAEKERSRVWRWMLDQLLANKINVPPSVLQD